MLFSEQVTNENLSGFLLYFMPNLGIDLNSRPFIKKLNNIVVNGCVFFPAQPWFRNVQLQNEKFTIFQSGDH